MAFSYRVDFQTKKGEWIEVRAPLKDFVATSFGRIVNNAGPVNAQQVNSIGFLLGDKKAGPFKLEVDWIKAEVAPASDVRQTIRRIRELTPARSQAIQRQQTSHLIHRVNDLPPFQTTNDAWPRKVGLEIYPLLSDRVFLRQG